MRALPSFFLLALPFLAACESPPGPDHIFRGGPILTVDAGDRVVEALAIRGNVITAVGTARHQGRPHRGA